MFDEHKNADFSGTMIFSDFDGTLTDNHGNIPEKNKEALMFYTTHGGLFTVCTGRTVQGFHRYSEEFINAPVVLANGCMCYDYRKGKQVFLEGIEGEGIDFVRTIRDTFPRCSIEIYPIFKTYTVHTSETTVRHLEGQSIDFEEIDDPKGIELPWQKVMIDCGDESLEVQQFCRENISSPVFIPTTGRFVEFIKPNRGKEFGCLRLAECLGISRENIIVAGDGYNDATMLELFDKSFCPSDASDEALATAKNIVCSRDEGTLYGVVRAINN